MRNEHELQSPNLTLADVARKVRETTLRAGSHVPTLILENAQQTITVPFEDFADTREGRTGQMAAWGFMLARNQMIGRPDQIFFIAEGWMSSCEEVQGPPSQDSGWVEVVMITGVDMRDSTSKGIVFEMMRNDEGQLVGLQQHSETVGRESAAEIENTLIVAFLKGLATGHAETSSVN